MASIGSNIKDLRERRGYSQDDLAKMIGKTRSAVSQYESGKIVPRMGVIEDIAKVFGVSKNVIISGYTRDEAISNDEYELVSLYRRMDPAHRTTLLETARAFSALSEKDGADGERVEQVGAVDAVR